MHAVKVPSCGGVNAGSIPSQDTGWHEDDDKSFTLPQRQRTIFARCSLLVSNQVIL